MSEEIIKITSLKDLANDLGLAEGTVSRALNNYSDISEKTRQRVKQRANELGYRPNKTARRLAKGVAEAVAYIMPKNSNVMADPFVSQLLQGLAQSLATKGWDLILSQASIEETEVGVLTRLINSQQVSGFVISRPLVQDQRIEFLRDSNFPFVVHGRSSSYSDYAWYDVDNERAFKESTEHLINLGHTRIGFLGASLAYNFAKMRLDGYKSALANSGIPYDVSIVQSIEMTDDAGEQATLALLAANNPPTAFVCVSDVVALGCIAALNLKKIVVGEAVSVIGYDGLPVAKHSNPPLTTMAQPLSESGIKLGEMLLALVDGADPRHHQILKTASLIKRSTDGPI